MSKSVTFTQTELDAVTSLYETTLDLMWYGGLFLGFAVTLALVFAFQLISDSIYDKFVKDWLAKKEVSK